MTMLSDEAQRDKLHGFMQDTAGWNAMVLIHRPGDVAALIPIAPKLRDIEIVIALDDGEVDLWKKGRPWKMGMTHTQAADFIRENSPSEEEFIKHGAEWTEQLFIRLGIPRRDGGR